MMCGTESCTDAILRLAVSLDRQNALEDLKAVLLSRALDRVRLRAESISCRLDEEELSQAQIQSSGQHRFSRRRIARSFQRSSETRSSPHNQELYAGQLHVYARSGYGNEDECFDEGLEVASMTQLNAVYWLVRIPTIGNRVGG